MDSRDPHDTTPGDALGAADYALGLLTLPLLGTTLMFATSGMTMMLKDRARRRRFLMLLLVLEAALIAAVLAWVLI